MELYPHLADKMNLAWIPTGVNLQGTLLLKKGSPYKPLFDQYVIHACP